MTDNVDDRKMGVEFGELSERLKEHDYPASTGELIDAYGEYKVDFQDGESTFREVMQGYEDTFESAEAVQQAVLDMVGSEAVGREGYSDRTPPAMGEESQHDQESF